MTFASSTRRAALAQLAGVLGSIPLDAADSPGRHMFLSLNSVLVNGRVGWPEFAQLAAQTGFPATDVMLKPAQGEGADKTRALLSKLRVRPGIIDFPVEFRKDDATFQESLKALDPAAQFAVEIGCPRMITWIMSSSDTPREELRALYKDRFSQSAAILAKHNVRLGLEFLGPLELRRKFAHEFIWRMDEMLAFTAECGPNVGLLLDSWHWHHAGATTDDIIRAGRNRIVHVHFNDAPALPPEQIRDNQRLLPGEGVINLTGFLRALQQIGYTDALSVEVFGRLNNATPVDAARQGLSTSLGVFKKAGVPEG